MAVHRTCFGPPNISFTIAWNQQMQQLVIARARLQTTSGSLRSAILIGWIGLPIRPGIHPCE